MLILKTRGVKKIAKQTSHLWYEKYNKLKSELRKKNSKPPRPNGQSCCIDIVWGRSEEHENRLCVY